MEGNTIAVQFVKATREIVLSFLAGAKRRIVIARAGYFNEEIELLLELAKKNIRCKLYVDTAENSVRYGFGEQKALEKIHENLDLLHVQSANYIRMAIVIVDDSVMVYSPVALSWEEVPEDIDFPNGFLGGRDLADSLLQQIDGKPIHLKIEGVKIDIPVYPVIQKTPEKIKQDIAKSISGLKENPPIDPVKLRKTTFYRHKYKLLKMTQHGTKIKNKSISLRPFNNMIPNANLRLKSSWSVLTREDVESLVEIKEFQKTLKELERKYTLDARRYGVMIETKNMKILEKSILCAVGRLKCCLGKKHDQKKAVLKDGSGNSHNSGQLPDKNAKAKEISLAGILDDSRKSLISYLFPQAMDEKRCWKQLFEKDQTLYRQMHDNEIFENEAVKKAVESFVDCRLNFPKSQEMIDLIRVEFDYYDISDELLAKNDFGDIIEESDIKVRNYQDGYEINSSRRTG